MLWLCSALVRSHFQRCFHESKCYTCSSAAPAGQPVDLTYAAEKALPAVVHIKYVQNSKVKT